MVYNRTRGKAGPVLEAGALEADSPEALFEWADKLVMMLSGPAAIDSVLEPIIRDCPGFFKGKTVINMGTNPPGFARQLATRVGNLQAIFVDAPVSGTRIPAEEGALLIMASGPEESINQLMPLFEAMGSRVIKCGNPAGRDGIS